MIPQSRRLALNALHLCLDQHQDLQAAVDTALSESAHAQDKNLATELVYGYTRFCGRLDAILNTLLSKPGKTSPGLRRILGLAAYEILFLDGVPEYASLDWAVSLSRKRFGQAPGKVANGVLRSLTRLGSQAQSQDYLRNHLKDDQAFKTVWYACPAWIVQLWEAAYGEEAAAKLLAASLMTPPPAVRLNVQHPHSTELAEKLRPLALQSSISGLAFRTWPAFLNEMVLQGATTRQSLAAQDIMHALAPADWPEPILDACAGRGGKTYLLAEMGKAIWASDVNMFRLRQLKNEGRRLGLPVPILRAPGQGPYPFRTPPQTILLDAPCSGLGVLARRPDIKWKRTSANCAQLAKLQRDMLLAAAAALPAGGNIAYVTCTLNPQENEQQIRGFLAERPDFRGVVETQTPTDSCLGEFFYGALLAKK